MSNVIIPLRPLASENFSRFVKLKKLGDVSNHDVHVWCNPASLIALPLTIQLQETIDPILCLIEKLFGVLLWCPVIDNLVNLLECSPYFDHSI